MKLDEIHHLYSELNTLSSQRAWPALEFRFYQLAEQYAGSELANRIRSLSLESYTPRLHDFLNAECLRLSHHAVRALYFEYNPDHQWDSCLLICDQYSPASSADNEWANHWIDRRVGPNIPEFAQIYQQHGGLHKENAREIAVTFFLIARITTAFGKALAGIPTHKMAVCIGHPGQEQITRIFESPFAK